MQPIENRKRVLKIGLLGSGFMGRMRAHAYTTVAHMFPNLPIRPQLFAVASLDEQNLPGFAARFDFRYYTNNWKEVVDDERIDILTICLPEHLHAEPAIRGLKSGKHVFCEKALAYKASSAFEMVEVAHQSGRVHMCGLNYRFLPAVQLARKLIHDGQLGQIYTLRASYFQESGHDPNRPIEEVTYAYGEYPLGSARGLGSHVIDTCRFLLGEMSVRQAVFRTFVAQRHTRSGGTYPVRTDDFALITVDFNSGCVGSLCTSKVATGRKNWFSFEVNGSKGSLIFDVEHLNYLRVYLEDGSSSPTRGFIELSVTEKGHPLMGNWWPPGHNLGWEHSHINEIYHFLNCVADSRGVDPLGATFDDGYQAVALVEQAESLSHSGS